MSIFASFFVEKGVFFTVCVYTAIDGREPRHTGPPKRVPSRTYALLTVAIFGPQGHQSSRTPHLRRLAGVGTNFQVCIALSFDFPIYTKNSIGGLR